MRKKQEIKYNMPVKSILEIEYKMKEYNYENPLKNHIYTEIIFVDYGQMEVTLKNSVLLLSAGDFLVIPSNMIHGITRKYNNRAFSYLNIMFLGSPAPSIVGKVYSLNTQEKDILRTIKEENADSLQNEKEITLVFLNLLLLLLERRSAYPIVSPHHMRNRLRYKNMIVNNILDYIDKNYDKSLNSEVIATKHGISQTHMRRLIKEITKLTLSQHLINTRINIAQHLMLESSKNINEIANKVGYNSVTHFCKVFKQETGVTPSQYVNSIGGTKTIATNNQTT